MICSFVWLFLGGFTKNMLQKTFFTGVIIGCITFGLGFFGPMIIAPEANQGPLLGILITGPLGFILGLIGGGFYWYFKLRNHSKS